MTKDKRRYINTTIWDKSWFRKLSSDARLVYIYLLTCPLSSISGVFEVADARIEFDTNIKTNKIRSAFNELQASGEVARVDDWVIIVRHPDFQKWQTNITIAIGLFKELYEIPKDVFLQLRLSGYQYPAITSTKAWQDERIRLITMEKNGKNIGMNDDVGFYEMPPYPIPSLQIESDNMDIPFGEGM